jgi:hypothetical protein
MHIRRQRRTCRRHGRGIDGEIKVSRAMNEFRCYFFNEDGHIGAAEDILAESEAEALGLARAAFALRDQHPSFELWQGQRRLHQEVRAPA